MPNLFTVLLMGGGEGSGKMYGIVKALNDAAINMQLIVISGRNESLKLRLEKLSKSLVFPMKVYGFTNEVPDIMSASDIIITKAGPGSIAEALAKDLPIIVTSWLPGQEEGNVQFVLDNGLGKVAVECDEIIKAIRSLREPAAYARIKKNIKKVNNPKAVFLIAKRMLERI